MKIAFCVNQGGLPGLGATLTSMFRHCSNDSRLELYILESDLKPTDLDRIRELCRDINFRGGLSFLSFDAELEFSHLRPLHGDWAAYARLLLPDLITGEKLLYLDSDLLLCLDVLEMDNISLKGELIGAYSGSELKHRIDKSLLCSVGCSEDMDYFNSGVLLINLERWKATDCTTRWRRFANTHPADLMSHDQTILNYLCSGSFVRLAKRYNFGWLAHRKEIDTRDKIIHFIGSPKPWDLPGRFLHGGYKSWKRFQPNSWNAAYGFSFTSKSDLHRMWAIRKSILRSIRKQMSI